MKQYLDTLQHVLDNGTLKKNRTGTDTLTVYGMQTRYNMGDGFPAITTKKLAWNAVVSELLWFLSGSGDINKLQELVGSDFTIWNANADADYWKPKAAFDGDVGRIYGVQWRSWLTPVKNADSGICTVKTTDQISDVIANIKAVKIDPTLSIARRLIVTAWNPGELDQMVLAPCHTLFQFHVDGDRLHLQMYQRSNDNFLGTPFNIASYSLLLHMMAQVTGFKPGDFIYDQGDVHIYENHLPQVHEQLLRTPHKLPSLWLNPDIDNLFDFGMDDIKLIDYTSHPAIKAKMAV